MPNTRSKSLAMCINRHGTQSHVTAQTARSENEGNKMQEKLLSLKM